MTAALASALILSLRIEMAKPELPATFNVPTQPADKSKIATHSSDYVPAVADAPSVHAPALTETEDGRVWCVWWGGSREGGADVRIFLAERKGDWTAPKIIMSREQAARELMRPIRRIGNAVICSRSTNELIVVFVTTTIGGWSTSALNLIRSGDRGQTWSKAQRLYINPVLNISELVRSQPIPYGEGFIFPVYHELAGKYPELLWLEGDTYRKTKAFGGRKAFQPSLAPVTPTTALMALRDPKRGNLYTSWTTDTGQTFGPPTRDEFPNPDAAVDVITLPGNRVLLAHNNSTDRRNLSLSMSVDDGVTWRVARVIEDDRDAEFSYPALHLGRDGNIHLAYTWKRERIRYHTFNDKWLEQ